MTAEIRRVALAPDSELAACLRDLAAHVSSIEIDLGTEIAQIDITTRPQGMEPAAGPA